MQSFKSFGNWNLIRSLGEGGFGEVHQWRHQLTEMEIATKSLKPNPKLKPDEIEVLKRRWVQEYNWMKSLDTPFIVGAIQIDDNKFLQYLQEQNQWTTLPVIVMEYCNGGDLRNVLERVENVNGLSEKDIRDILRSVSFAVNYLHQKFNIEHRDIKPENIVINQSGEYKTYKLTDFGYAREIPEHTIAQSVVGTRHYVAPEVIDPGCYTKTVDYWSVGVLCYEIICGVRPFIPHRDFRLILTNIFLKPKKCIAITQCIDDPEADRFSFEEKIIRQNKCSPIFLAKIEKWLMLALDNDYKQRGNEGGQLKFYSTLDSILKTNVLSVYSISGFNFFYYDINKFKDNERFLRELSKDTKIPCGNMYLTLPISHPKKSLGNIKVPQDYFVSDWLDPYNPDNPPAMLYVSNIEQCDFNGDIKEMFNAVPKIINICMSTHSKNYDRVPVWLLEQFEKEVHYLLSEHQRYVDCHMKALFNYIISIEDDVFQYEAHINKVHEYTTMLSGGVRQFHRTIQKYTEISGVEIAEFVEMANMFSKDCSILKENVTSNILKRYKSVLSRCKALSCNDVYNGLPKKDIYKLNDFRRLLIKVLSHNFSNSERMTECVKAFETWIVELTNFSRNIEVKKIHNEIYDQYDIFRKIDKNVKDILKYIEKFEKKLDEETSNLLQMISNNDQMLKQMHCLSIRNPSDFSLPASNASIINGDFLPNGEVFDSSVSRLIENTNNLLLSVHSVMEIDDTNNMCVDIPTTVQYI